MLHTMITTETVLDPTATEAAEPLVLDRTFRSSLARAWMLLATPAGATAWLGDSPSEWWTTHPDANPAFGDVLQTPGGERYEVERCEPEHELRLHALGPAMFDSTIVMTLTPERGRTIVELRQEGLPATAPQEQLRDHWDRALDRIELLLDGEQPG